MTKNYRGHKSLTGGGWQEILMLLPMFTGFLIFTIYPILWVIRWAWFDYGGYGKPFFVGVDNFIRAFTRDTNFWSAMLNTVYLAVVKLILEMPLSIVLAFFVNKRVKGSSVLRIIYFLPTIFSIAVIGMVFSILFSAYNGIINAVLVHLHIVPANINWFGSRWLAMTVILMVSLWSTFGLNMVYFLMGLQNIPNELYECSMLDGASGPRQFFSITLPLLAPVMQIVFMLSVLGTMRLADLVLVMTNGQPGGSTEVIMTYIFKFFFQYGEAGTRNQYGYGSALSVVTALILAVITVVYLKQSKKMKEIY
ncbi:MAG: sugar ABC transporter permease [Treponema sp.]|jgi:raffinose/stachyose/melibiose transport system permease protein|nr:sugar ABC transporter permease [Treponema sp.]